MDLKNKLKGLPTIYYLNSDDRGDRKNYMESQFDYWDIKRYNRISVSKYLAKNFNEWKSDLIDDKIVDSVYCMSAHLNHIKTIINWYDKNISNTCIIMEDDLSLNNIKYWNFDWKYFEKNLPDNWECIQLYFCRNDYIPMFLHKRICGSSSAACYMINRTYGKKIKDLMWINGKYKITLRDNSYQQKYYPTVVDGNLFDIGVTYSVPIFNINENIKGDNPGNNYKTNLIDNLSSQIIKDWWENEHHNFSLEDFFTYGKPNDFEMIREVNYKKEINKKISYS